MIVGIWGLESSFGTKTGDFRVVQALATLAWEGRRASFFRGELIAALHILDSGDVTPGRMTGSYAGAMGQPQFMPSSYLRYAVDFEGNGRRDIWTSMPDMLASIANYLAPLRLARRRGLGPAGDRAARASMNTGRAATTACRWANGRGWACARWTGGAGRTRDAQAAVLLPDGAGGEAFLAYRQFRRDPPLQSVRLLRHRGRPDRRPGRDLMRRLALALAVAGAGCGCSAAAGARSRITCWASRTRRAASGSIRGRRPMPTKPGSRWSMVPAIRR